MFTFLCNRLYQSNYKLIIMRVRILGHKKWRFFRHPKNKKFKYIFGRKIEDIYINYMKLI